MDLIKHTLRWILNPRSNLRSVPGPTIDDSQGPAPFDESEAHIGERSRSLVLAVLTNPPLMLGGLIVLGLFMLVLFGPVWAPYNPYIASEHIVPHFNTQSGEWISPPLAPSEAFPLGTDQYGNDILSMLLYGARNTLIACAFITMVRVLLGLGFGAMAGWKEGGLADTIVMGFSGVINSVPMLISSMLLIYALDIRRGLPVFIIALAGIGWTEIAQYLRSEILVIRKMPFMEGAQAVGTGSLPTVVWHIIPNLLPQLLVITFLELGAVLMLLGELSFIGVFIGGGSRIALGDEMTGITLVTQSEIPEWGAMLAEGYTWLRSKPFMVFPPATAFFISVAGATALGEGLRRLIKSYPVSTMFLLRKRMLLVITALSFATVFIINNTGPAPWFEKVARSFNGNSALRYTEELIRMDGRSSGQSGGSQAAAYIAEKFELYGLDPGWKHSEYIYPLETRLVQPVTQPVLHIIGADGHDIANFRHQVDFGYIIDGHGGSGQALSTLTFVGFDGAQDVFGWETFKGLDLRGRIVLLVQGNAPVNFATEALIRGAQGVLWVVQDAPDAVRSQNQLAFLENQYLATPTLPIFKITTSVADEILTYGDTNLAKLFDAASNRSQIGPGWFTQEIEVSVQMALELSEVQEVTIPCILGFLPGSDIDLAHQLSVVFAHYDGLGADPDGTIYPGANHNASGISIMLEIARLWQKQEINTRRPVMFVAWGGGALDHPGSQAYLEEVTNFRHLPNARVGSVLRPMVIFQLDRVGAGGDSLIINSNAPGQKAYDRLSNLAIEAGIPLAGEGGDSSETSSIARASRIPWVSLAWSDSVITPDQDTIEDIQAEKLTNVGEILVYLLTTIVRETAW